MKSATSSRFDTWSTFWPVFSAALRAAASLEPDDTDESLGSHKAKAWLDDRIVEATVSWWSYVDVVRTPLVCDGSVLGVVPIERFKMSIDRAS